MSAHAPVGRRPRIGIAADVLQPDPRRAASGSPPLHYVEATVAHWVAAGGAQPYLVPSPWGETDAGWPSATDYARDLDGLVLEGGTRTWRAPQYPGSGPPEIDSDPVREYELALLRAFVAQGKPVLGLCRGLQLINLAFGGTVDREAGDATDPAAALRRAFAARSAGLAGADFHDVSLTPGSRLAALYPGRRRGRVNAIAHPSIRELAPGFSVEARAVDDGRIEAMRLDGALYVAAVQWHPEWHRHDAPELLPSQPLLDEFLARVAAP